MIEVYRRFLLSLVDDLYPLGQLLQVMLPDAGVDDLLADDLAVEHLEHPMRVVLHVDVVCHHHQGNLLPDVQPKQDIQDYESVAGVEVASWLVQKQHLGSVGEGSGDRDSLLLAAGELVGKVAQSMRHADGLQQHVCAIRNLSNRQLALNHSGCTLRIIGSSTFCLAVSEEIRLKV